MESALRRGTCDSVEEGRLAWRQNRTDRDILVLASVNQSGNKHLSKICIICITC